MVSIVRGEQSKVATCKQCLAILEYVFTETKIQKVFKRVRLGDRMVLAGVSAYRYITCPVCEFKIDLRED